MHCVTIPLAVQCEVMSSIKRSDGWSAGGCRAGRSRTSCERVCRLSVSDIIIVSLSAAQLQSDGGSVREGERGVEPS